MEKVNIETGEILNESSELNQIQIIKSKRPNGRIRRQLDFSNCPSLTEQHTAHLTDLNYLVKKYKPDELTAYLQARSLYRVEILGHDFTREPSLMDAKNEVVRLQKEFEKLPLEITGQFQSLKQFLSFIDNPANAEKMLRMGLLTKKQIESVTPGASDPSASDPKAEAKGTVAPASSSDAPKS